ncbi:MAG: hypothetical protein KBE24_03750 [Fusobacteriaceae bacterium]|nr:hypothetical protein [Fusobacteriaceae bacterium]MBP9595875.1 hypothetical protein [Fusobacteriaceae bacterium]
MKNIELLLDKKNQCDTLRGKQVIKNKYKSTGKPMFNGIAFQKFIEKINKIICRENIENELPVELKIGKVFFKDKATYILLEAVIYLLLRDYNVKLTLSITPKIDGLYDGDIKKSLIYKNKNTSLDKNKYINDFKKFNLELNHFRKIIIYKTIEENGIKLSVLSTELACFFKNYIDDDEYVDSLVEVLGELADNSLSHGESDCLIDINIETVYNRKNPSPNKYISLDIVIVNFDKKLLGDRIKDKFFNNDFKGSPKTEKLLNTALENHKSKFSESYTFDDFCNCASFQWRVSSRQSSSDSFAGTGLTTLIDGLINKSESVYCYVYSGNKIINFINGMVSLDENRFIGFNKENDFLNKIPDKSSITRSNYNLNGVLYNLNFIVKKEGVDNENG